MKLVKAFGWFWWDLVIGDDWRIAAYVLGVVGAGAVLAVAGAGDAVVGVGVLVALMGCFALFVSRDARR